MRKAARAIVPIFLSLLAAAVLGITSAFAAALALGATALIVPGTGTHNINPPNAVTGYKENARDRFIAPADPSCTEAMGCVLVGVDYPATFFPIPFPGWCPGLSCDTWNVSVGEGVENLNSELINQLANPTANNQTIVLFGYSQGGAVVSHEMYNLAGLDPDIKKRITVVTIGNIENPQGLWGRLSFLPTIPFLDITFGPQLPTDLGIRSTNYVFEYDPVGDAALYWGNPLALLNMVAALEYVHGDYLVPNSNSSDPLPYGYTPETLATAIQNADKRTYQDATFVLIPQQGTLPIMQPFVNLAASTSTSALVQPIVDLISPVFKVLIDLGYDRVVNPGIPAQTLSILPFDPFQNWIEVGIDLVAATVEGIEAFHDDLDPRSTVAPVTSPSSQPSISLMSALAGPAPADPPTSPVREDVSASEESTPATLTLVKEERDAGAQNADVVEGQPAVGGSPTQSATNETTPTTPSDPPATGTEQTNVSGLTEADEKNEQKKDTVDKDKKDADKDKKDADEDKKYADEDKKYADEDKKDVDAEKTDAAENTPSTADNGKKDADAVKKDAVSNDADNDKAAA